jgi:hypothetical protein
VLDLGLVDEGRVVRLESVADGRIEKLLFQGGVDLQLGARLLDNAGKV